MTKEQWWNVISRGNSRREICSIGFEVFTVVTMDSTVFWVVTPCSSVRDRCFGATYRFHLQFRIICLARNEQEASTKKSEASGLFLDAILLGFERVDVPPKITDSLRTTWRYKPEGNSTASSSVMDLTL
jgi:hypothetical protein